MAPKTKPTAQLNMAEIMEFITKTGTKDLQELSFAIEKQRLAKRDGELSEAKEKIDAILSKIDADLYDIYPHLKAKKTTNGSNGVRAPKYRLPDGTEWAGLGRMKNEFKAALIQEGIESPDMKDPKTVAALEKYSIH